MALFPGDSVVTVQVLLLFKDCNSTFIAFSNRDPEQPVENYKALQRCFKGKEEKKKRRTNLDWENLWWEKMDERGKA